jgi:hypothetical protein
MWKQHSKIMWLAPGDRNMRFFHLRASQRRNKNRISKLKKPDGQFMENVEEMGAMATEIYKLLYSTEGTFCMDRVLDMVLAKVIATMNDNLMAPFAKEEIKNDLFQKNLTKALGLDGLPAHFFQRHWKLCGEEVTTVVLRVLRGEDDPSIISNTCIVLTPKVESLEELSLLRPISLCNVIYKIASKMMANRLKIALPEIVSKEQSTFVPGHLITDNIVTFFSAYIL